jgi:hypothetical protein
METPVNRPGTSGNMAFVLLTVCMSFGGCAVASKTLIAENLQYPVSMTSRIHNHSGVVVDSMGYVVLHDWSIIVPQWRLGWLLPLSSEYRDISDEIDEAVRTCNGDGIVNLQVERSAVSIVAGIECLASFIGSFYYLTFVQKIPVVQGFYVSWAAVLASFVVLPDVTRYKVSGDIVRFR